MFESARSYDHIKTEIFTLAVFGTSLTIFLADCTFEPWIQIAFVTEPSPEERADALDVTIEVPTSQTTVSIWCPHTQNLFWTVTGHAPLCVRVRRANHLREIDNHRFSRGPTD